MASNERSRRRHAHEHVPDPAELWILLGLGVFLAAALITHATRPRDVASFSTGDDQASLCAGAPAASGGRCVTQKRGAVVSLGYRSCGTPAPPRATAVAVPCQ